MNEITTALAKALQRSRLLGALAGVGLAAIGTVACNPTAETREDDRPQVVVTSTILTDLTATVGGDEIAVTGLLEPGDDPHLYEPVPEDTQVLEQADLIFYNGYNLEPALIRLSDGAGVEAEQVALAEQVEPLEFEEGQTEPDPHVWGDVENAIVLVEAIAATLSEQFPEDAAVFDQNAADLIEELRALDGWIVTQMETIPPDQRTLVTTHDAFQYYADAYGLTVLGTLIGISTEEQPSAQTVQQLVEEIRQAQVPAIFAETTLNPALITTVAEEAGVQLADPALYSDSLGAAGSGAETYITMMVTNTETVVRALGGEVEPY